MQTRPLFPGKLDPTLGSKFCHGQKVLPWTVRPTLGRQYVQPWAVGPTLGSTAGPLARSDAV